MVLAYLLAACALAGLAWWLLDRHSRGAEIATDISLPLAVISTAVTLWTARRPYEPRPRPTGVVAANCRRPAFGTGTVLTATSANANALGVHHARVAGSVLGAQGLTPYLARQHDDDLRAVIANAVAGGSSVLALLTGDSTTGKTRALFEALRSVVPHHQILWPRDADDLGRMLADGEIDAGKILWLNETQKYFYGEPGARAARDLNRLLGSKRGIIGVGAIWNRPYFRELTALGQTPDIYADVRDLLTGPGTRIISVPASLDREQCASLLNLAPEDERLSVAVSAGAKDGRVIQHLTGGPELLEEYLRGSLFDPVEHALITAALDTRRLGYEAPIPRRMLAAAAEGYISPADRPAGGEDYWAAGLVAITTGVRSDDSRTDVRNILTALTTHQAAPEAEPCYEIDGYLDQQVRRFRERNDGPPELWAALAAQISDADVLYRLGSLARRKGLDDSAAHLLRKAVSSRHPFAAAGYVAAAKAKSAEAARRAGLWAARHTRLDDPSGLALLVEQLRSPLTSEALTALLARRPAGQASLVSPHGVARLLEQLRLAGAHEALADLMGRNPAAQVHLRSSYGLAVLLTQLQALRWDKELSQLLARDPAAHVSLLNPDGMAFLITQLFGAKADGQARALTRRAAREMNLASPACVASLLRLLRSREAGSEIDSLLAREPAACVNLDKPSEVAFLLRQLRDAHAHEQVTALGLRATAYVALENPHSVSFLLRELRNVRAQEAIDALLARDPAAQVSLANLQGVASALKQLQECGDAEAAARLARRAASGIRLENPQDVATLLRQLRESGCQEAIALVLARDIVAEVRIDRHGGIAFLLGQLRDAGANALFLALGLRAAREMALDDPQGVALVLQQLRGADPDGTTVLLGRDPAALVGLDDPGGISFLLSQLMDTDPAAADALLARNPAARVGLTDSRGVASLLRQFREAGADNAIRTLLAREPAVTVRVSDARGVNLLLAELRHLRATRACTVLMQRAGQDSNQTTPLGASPSGRDDD